MNPAVSIVIPLYNAEKYIEACINSVLTQTFADFELIIVDDCSNDRSLEIVQGYQDPRIKIIHQIKNSGESSSRNLGLANARGKYVFFMDHDDAALNGLLETFYQTAEESNADVVHMNSWIDTDENFPSDKTSVFFKEYCNNPEPRFFSDDLETRLQNEFLNLGIFTTPWLKFSRREFLIDSGLYFPDMTRCGDLLHSFAELCFARKIQVIDACGYVYRVHSEQTLKQSTEKQLRNALKSLPSAIDFIKQVFSSKKLIAPVSKQFQISFERYIITHFFRTYICKAYKERLSYERIDEIFREVLSQPNAVNLEFMLALIDLIAVDYASE